MAGLRKFDSSSVPVSGSQGARPPVLPGQKLVSKLSDFRFCAKRQLNILRAIKGLVKEKFEIFGVYTFPPKSNTPINLGHKMMGACRI